MLIKQEKIPGQRRISGYATVEVNEELGFSMACELREALL